MRRIRPLIRFIWISLCLAGMIGIGLIFLNKFEIYYCGVIILIFACASIFWAIDDAIRRDEKLGKMSKEERERERLKLKKIEELHYRFGKISAVVNILLGIILFFIIIIMVLVRDKR